MISKIIVIFHITYLIRENSLAEADTTESEMEHEHLLRLIGLSQNYKPF